MSIASIPVKLWRGSKWLFSSINSVELKIAFWFKGRLPRFGYGLVRTLFWIGKIGVLVGIGLLVYKYKDDYLIPGATGFISLIVVLILLKWGGGSILDGAEEKEKTWWEENCEHEKMLNSIDGHMIAGKGIPEFGQLLSKDFRNSEDVK